jgi:hypothetical protein
MFDIAVRIDETKVTVAPLSNKGHEFLDLKLGKVWDYGPRTGNLDLIKQAGLIGLAVNVRYW